MDGGSVSKGMCLQLPSRAFGAFGPLGPGPSICLAAKHNQKNFHILPDYLRFLSMKIFAALCSQVQVTVYICVAQICFGPALWPKQHPVVSTNLASCLTMPTLYEIPPIKCLFQAKCGSQASECYQSILQPVQGKFGLGKKQFSFLHRMLKTIESRFIQEIT